MIQPITTGSMIQCKKFFCKKSLLDAEKVMRPEPAWPKRLRRPCLKRRNSISWFFFIFFLQHVVYIMRVVPQYQVLFIYKILFFLFYYIPWTNKFVFLQTRAFFIVWVQDIKNWGKGSHSPIFLIKWKVKGIEYIISFGQIIFEQFFSLYFPM